MDKANKVKTVKTNVHTHYLMLSSKKLLEKAMVENFWQIKIY